eukprot:11976667-Alexandrium_andersonii.AAC.1
MQCSRQITRGGPMAAGTCSLGTAFSTCMRGDTNAASVRPGNDRDMLPGLRHEIRRIRIERNA